MQLTIHYEESAKRFFEALLSELPKGLSKGRVEKIAEVSESKSLEVQTDPMDPVGRPPSSIFL